ncbi:mannosyltransferase [Phlegmacium glaucopus]|nr:mannosyltransferase [Phlegmacium glaucopus]
MTTSDGTLIFYVVALPVLAFLTWITWNSLRPHRNHSSRSVAILVLGDIGRSPRMMYHAQSFADAGFITHLIGYGGSKPIAALERLPKMQLCYIPEIPKIFRRLPFLILAPVKIIHQLVHTLLWLLVWIDLPPEFILVQNPPTIPTLALVQLVGRVRGSKVIIDWHNLGYSILGLKLGSGHLLVRIAKRFEEVFGYSAYAHLFVTRAMQDFLVREWDLQGHTVVLHDRPPRRFHRCPTDEIHELFRKLQPSLSSQRALHDFLPESSLPFSTSFTTTRPSTVSSMPSLRTDRPALLVSSTSWTPDEDFSILLEALGLYEKRSMQLASSQPTSHGQLPKLLVIVTGKGPLREKYMEEVGKLQKSWKWVRCISLWLEAEDYPLLLGSADLGVCLHSSSSGLDLPMKVVDMFGCGLPVCAIDFACLDELVKDGKNGLIFQNASQLAEQFEELLTSFPSSPKLSSLTASLASLSQRSEAPLHTHMSRQYPNPSEEVWTWETWEDNWSRVVRPLILSDVNL